MIMGSLLANLFDNGSLTCIPAVAGNLGFVIGMVVVGVDDGQLERFSLLLVCGENEGKDNCDQTEQAQLAKHGSTPEDGKSLSS